jgi:hypothetical protein
MKYKTMNDEQRHNSHPALFILTVHLSGRLSWIGTAALPRMVCQVALRAAALWKSVTVNSSFRYWIPLCIIWFLAGKRLD